MSAWDEEIADVEDDTEDEDVDWWGEDGDDNEWED